MTVRHTPYNNAVSASAHYVRSGEARRLCFLVG